MKKIVLTIVALFALNATAFAAGNFGPITPESNKTFSIGAEYFNYKQEWDVEDSDDSLDTTQNQFSANLAYNIANKAEVTLKLGVADMTGENVFDATSPFTGEYVTEDFEGNYEPFGTVAAKGIVYQQGVFSVGPFAQFSMYSPYEKDKTWTDSYTESYSYWGHYYDANYEASLKQTVKIENQYDLTLGITGQVDVLKNDKMNVSIYGGPYYRLARAEGTVIEDKVMKVTNPYGSHDYISSNSVTVDLENKDEFGIFVGTSINVGYGVSINGDGQFSSEPSLGISITKSF